MTMGEEVGGGAMEGKSWKWSMGDEIKPTPNQTGIPLILMASPGLLALSLGFAFPIPPPISPAFDDGALLVVLPQARSLLG